VRHRRDEEEGSGFRKVALSMGGHAHDPYAYLLRRLDLRLSSRQKRAFLLRLRRRRRIRPVLVDRLAALAGILLTPLVMWLRREKSDAPVLIVELGQRSSVFAIRREFVRHYDSGQTREDTPIACTNGSRFVFSRLNVEDRRLFWRLWRTFFAAIVQGLAFRRQIPLAPLPAALMALFSVACSPDKRIFMFQIYGLDSYLVAVLIERLLGRSSRISASNSVLYCHNRYLELPRSELMLCSRPQVAELGSLQKRGWVEVQSATLWGLEEIQTTRDLVPTPPRYHIGIYCSGEWARKDGRFAPRRPGPEVIRHQNNERHRAFMAEVLEPILRLCREERLRACAYLHPYERRLLKNLGLDPPYADLLRSEGVVLATSGESSLSRVYDCHVGVSLSSTVIFDRWHLGLDGLLFWGAVNRPFMRPGLLGVYANNFFSDESELRRKVMDCLADCNGIPLAPAPPPPATRPSCA